MNLVHKHFKHIHKDPPSQPKLRAWCRNSSTRCHLYGTMLNRHLTLAQRRGTKQVGGRRHNNSILPHKQEEQEENRSCTSKCTCRDDGWVIMLREIRMRVLKPTVGARECHTRHVMTRHSHHNEDELCVLDRADSLLLV